MIQNLSVRYDRWDAEGKPVRVTIQEDSRSRVVTGTAEEIVVAVERARMNFEQSRQRSLR